MRAFSFWANWALFPHVNGDRVQPFRAAPFTVRHDKNNLTMNRLLGAPCSINRIVRASANTFLRIRTTYYSSHTSSSRSLPSCRLLLVLLETDAPRGKKQTRPRSLRSRFHSQRRVRPPRLPGSVRLAACFLYFFVQAGSMQRATPVFKKMKETILYQRVEPRALWLSVRLLLRSWQHCSALSKFSRKSRKQSGG